MTTPPPLPSQSLLDEAAEMERMAQLCSYAPDKQRLLARAADLRQRAARPDTPDAPPRDGPAAAPAQAKRLQGFTSLRLPFRWP